MRDTLRKDMKIILDIYKIIKEFPDRESFALNDQTRRAVISITSNIAEGFTRKSEKEKIKFYFISLGSLVEVQNLLLIARDVGYLKRDGFSKIAEQTIELSKLINGLIKSSSSKPA